MNERTNAPLGVLMATDYFPPHVGGGVERAVYEISKRLAGLGHRITVLTLNTRAAPPRETIDDMEIIRVPALDLSGVTGVQLAVSPWAWPALSRLIRERRFDLVHAHNVFFHVALAGAVLAKRHSVPLVTTAHLGSPADLARPVRLLTTAYERSLGRWILQHSERAIAVSNAVARHLTDLGVDRDSIVVIPNGVDAGRFAPRPSIDSDGRPRIVCVGRLIANKGPQFLVEAVPRIASAFPGARVQFVGDGPLRSSLEQRVRELDQGDHVEFLGEREDVPEQLRGADVLVRPSLLEGLPLTVLEGMACGLPVVASRVGGTPEIVLDNVSGYLVEPGDIDQLADRICRLLADPQARSEMGEHNRAQVQRGYDWTEVTTRTLATYYQALGMGASAETAAA